MPLFSPTVLVPAVVSFARLVFSKGGNVEEGAQREIEVHSECMMNCFFPTDMF